MHSKNNANPTVSPIQFGSKGSHINMRPCIRHMVHLSQLWRKRTWPCKSLLHTIRTNKAMIQRLEQQLERTLYQHELKSEYKIGETKQDTQEDGALRDAVSLTKQINTAQPEIETKGEKQYQVNRIDKGTCSQPADPSKSVSDRVTSVDGLEHEPMNHKQPSPPMPTGKPETPGLAHTSSCDVQEQDTNTEKAERSDA
eukprot:859294_1